MIFVNARRLLVLLLVLVVGCKFIAIMETGSLIPVKTNEHCLDLVDEVGFRSVKSFLKQQKKPRRQCHEKARVSKKKAI